KIPLCVAYDVDGVRHDRMPMTQSEFHHAKPIVEYHDGWNTDISAARTFEELPKAAQNYIARIEELCHTRISGIGVGPGRDELIVRTPLI
ncbi:MAG: adenylosuccinate synthetase, partial [Propionibacteriaceae bacterium]